MLKYSSKIVLFDVNTREKEYRGQKLTSRPVKYFFFHVIFQPNKYIPFILNNYIPTLICELLYLVCKFHRIPHNGKTTFEM